MRAFHAEPDAIKRDEIAGQLLVLSEAAREKLCVHHVKEMFEQLKDGA